MWGFVPVLFNYFQFGDFKPDYPLCRKRRWISFAAAFMVLTSNDTFHPNLGSFFDSLESWVAISNIMLKQLTLKNTTLFSIC